MTKILIADDEQYTLDWLKHRLESKGHEVDISTSESDTIKAINKNIKYDLIILDVQMRIAPFDEVNNMYESEELFNSSRTSGLRILSYIRNKKGINKHTLPIICYTVLDDDETVSKITNLGAQHIKKGEDVSNFLRTIDKNLKQ